MRFNIEKIARLLGLESSRLNSAIQKASSMSNGVTSKSDAMNILRKNGIDNNALSRMQNIINSNPVASKIAGMAGFNISDINRGINSLKEDTTYSSRAPEDDRIIQMKKRLAQVKK